jgi:hypothetical protein
LGAHQLKLIILLLPRKVVGTNIFKTQIENYVHKEKAFNDLNSPFQKEGEGRRRKEVKENPNSMANGRFQCLGPCEPYRHDLVR